MSSSTNSQTKSQGQVKRWHIILFDAIAGLLILLMLFGSGRCHQSEKPERAHHRM